jgi:glycosidase
MIFFILSFKLSVLMAQEIFVEKIEPPNWWAGMKTKQLQLMLYGKNLDQFEARFDSEKIQIKHIQRMQNDVYAFIDLEISPDINPGIYQLIVGDGNRAQFIAFPVLERQPALSRFHGFDSSDIIYLITPDRFANGDPENDVIEGMRDGYRPDDILGRHGGDIQGIINHLDYMKELGITAIWINPLLENDMDISYHGYAATDLYRIDPRFGDNQLYKKLVHIAHEKGIKIIMDHVSNHIGRSHRWMNNLPMPDWINGSSDNHLVNLHHKESLYDPHDDPTLRKNVQNGWFVNEMPDLNQKNAFLAQYLIQNTIWWIEHTGIDGIREDTYPYADLNYYSRWARSILEEYPDFNIVGEVWIHDPVFLAPFQRNSRLAKEFDSYLPSVTDFGLFEAFGRIFNRNQSIQELYNFISRDFLYSDPLNLLIFLDNHDVMRLADLVKGNRQRYKMALQILLTTRGIPQIYYGTEIALPGGTDHGEIRADFPGGFPGTERNTFKREGRTESENEIWDFVQQMIRIRKENRALSAGKLVHIPPENEFYPYFRILGGEKVFIIVNNKDEKRHFNLTKVAHFIPNDARMVDLKSENEIPYSENMKIEIPAFDLGLYRIGENQSR